MTEVLALKLNSEEQGERNLSLAGLATEARECRTNEAFRTNQITINPPEDPSEARNNIVFMAARI